MRIDAGLATEQTLGEFDARLFEADEENRKPFFDDNVPNDVERERRFPDAGTCRNNHEFVVLHPRREVVEIDVPRRDAAHREVLVRLPIVDAVECFAECVAERFRLAGGALLRNFEDLAFGHAEEFVGGNAAIVSIAEEFRTRVDEVANDRFFANDAGVMLGVRRRRGAVEKLRNVRRPAHVFELLPFLEFLE